MELGLLCLLIGAIIHSKAIQFGFCIILFWILFSVIDEIRICYAIRKDSSRSDVNEIYDKLFGEEEMMKKLLNEGKDIGIMKERFNNRKGDDNDEE